MPSPVHPYSEYGVALRTLKSARTWLGYLLFLCVVAQVVGFLLMWSTQQPYKGLQAKYETQRTQWDVLNERISQLAGRFSKVFSGETATRPDTNAPAVSTSNESGFYNGTDRGRKLNVRLQWDTTYTMTVPFTQIVGLMAVCSQVIVMFLTLLLILVAQAPGVVHVTRGLIWSILLLFMVLPWQSFVGQDFPFPGVLYGYEELLRLIGPHVAGEKVYGFHKLIVYARFLFWPAASMLVLLIVSERFRAGILLAIGHPLQSMMKPGALPGKIPAAMAPSMGPKAL